MHCPFCNFADTKVVDSRLSGNDSQVRRRRECLNCGSRWSTIESAELNLPRVIKKDNSREDFSEKKVELGILRALNKREGFNFFFPSSNEFNLLDFSSIERYLNSNNFNLIINLAAYTNVENSESYKNKANLINNLAVKKR